MLPGNFWTYRPNPEPAPGPTASNDQWRAWRDAHLATNRQLAADDTHSINIAVGLALVAFIALDASFRFGSQEGQTPCYYSATWELMQDSVIFYIGTRVLSQFSSYADSFFAQQERESLDFQRERELLEYNNN